MAMPGVTASPPYRRGEKSYLLVLAGMFVAMLAGALVFSIPGVEGSLGFSPQPANTAPATTLTNTITMYILFIVRVTLTRSPTKTSRILK